MAAILSCFLGKGAFGAEKTGRLPKQLGGQVRCQVSWLQADNDRIQAGGVTVGLDRKSSRTTRLSRFPVAPVNGRYGGMYGRGRGLRSGYLFVIAGLSGRGACFAGDPPARFLYRFRCAAQHQHVIGAENGVAGRPDDLAFAASPDARNEGLTAPPAGSIRGLVLRSAIRRARSRGAGSRAWDRLPR